MSSRTYECDCGKRYVSPLAVADCMEQDAAEDYDREHGRIFAVNRDDNPPAGYTTD